MAKAIGYMKPDIDPNMRLYVPFNEGVGSIAKDYSQYGNHAQLTDVEWSPDGFNGAGKFNGSSSYGDCGNNASLNTTDAITIEAWVKPNAFGTSTTTILKNQGSAPTRFPFVIGSWSDWGNNWGAGFYDGSWHTVDIGSLISTEIWHYTIFTYNGVNLKIYVDGILKDNLNYVGSLPVSTGSLGIGAFAGSDRYFNGTIDNIRIYNRALSAPQILADCYGVVCN